MRSKPCKLSCRSVRDVFVLMVFVFLVSTLITIYNIVSYLPWLRDEQLTLHWERSAEKLYYMQESGTHGTYGHRPFQQQFRSHRETTHSKKPSQILTTLLKLQGTIFSDRRSSHTAMLWLPSKSTNQESEQYSKALKRLGFQVQFVEPMFRTQQITKNNDTLQKYLRFGNWTLFLCFSFGSGCLQNMDTSKLHSFQKVNNIPELLRLVAGKENLCRLIEATRRIPDWIGGLNQSPCYHVSDLPLKNGQLSNTDNDTWWGIYENAGGGMPQLQLLTREKLKFLKPDSLPNNTVLQSLPLQFMLLDDQAVFMRVFVSVTSLRPIRTYLHAEAISLIVVKHKNGPMTLENSSKTVKLWHVFQDVNRTHGPAAAEKLFTRLKIEIISLLMLAETLVTQSTANRANNTLRTNCFQMLQMDLTFDTNFRPFIIDVQGLPAGDQNVKFPTPATVIQDSLNMVLQESSVTIDVAYGLDELGWDVGLMGSQCNTFDKLCLNNAQLLYLLESRAESLNMGGYIRLYPSEESGMLNGLVRQLQRFLLYNRQEKLGKEYNTISNIKNNHRSKGPPLHTAVMHSLLLGLEKFYATNSNKAYMNGDDQELSDSYEDSNIPKKTDLLSQTTISVTNAKIVERQYQQADDNEKKYLRSTCSDDPLDTPYLMNIMTEPQINITPKFDSSVVSYEVSVPYEILLIKIWAFARSCQCEARMDDKFGVSRPANYTLGVGTNRVTLVVVDVTHPEPLVVNTYIVHIHRRTLLGTEFNKDHPHSVCSLKQDCSLKFVPNIECGLQNTAFDSWSDLLSYIAILPPCVTSDMPGQWVVPCSQCSPNSLCYWQKAIWQPKSCTYRWISRNKLTKCFARKKILFLGDSTNRGIMHYLLEQVNGTLQEWDKTHDIKLYSNLNNHKTSMSFAYYPQFWLPTDHRPTFDKAFYQLVRKNLPLENNTNTALVIGGVHWLDKRHVDIIMRGIQREGLTGIKLIIKDLGAGFHQPVEGLHCLTQKEQQKLLLHNIALTSYARQHGFHVVETFNMTMGRYKDFLQGQCACHFHRVVVQKKQKQNCGHRCPSHRSHQPKVSSPPSFHVEGEINAVYSEMMITQICSHMIYDGV